MEWKVSREIIKIFPHPNADALELAKVGSYQLVVGKGLYKDGDEVIFIPERSVLPEGPFRQEFGHMLSGPEQDRVKMVTLRGAQSYGVTWPVRGEQEYPADGSLRYPPLVKDEKGVPLEVQPAPGPQTKYDWDFSAVRVGVDISKDLNITRYEPEIPAELLESCHKRESYRLHQKHDCVPYGVYTDEFTEGEEVLVTEKVHGTQVDVTLDLGINELSIASKSFGSDYAFNLDADNVYTRAVKNSELVRRMEQCFPGASLVQVTGEAIPGQKGNWKYGQVDGKGRVNESVVVFKVRVDGETIPYNEVPMWLQQLWAPVLYRGPYEAPIAAGTYEFTDPETGVVEERTRYTYPMLRFAEGKEQVSGKEAHIREGAVITPLKLRKAADGTWLQLKMINPKYKPTGEETN